MAIKITCIKKDGGDHYDPHEGITDFGWINDYNGEKGESTRAAMIKFLEDRGKAYVDAYPRAELIVVSRNNNKYVKTIADGKETNNLLELPECIG